MSHWLDDAARGLAEGTFTRRAVLRRGGAIAGGALLASVTSPMRPLTRAAATSRSGVPCPKVPCLPSDVCCGGNKCCSSNTHVCCEGQCLENGGPDGCCGGRVYPTKFQTCCGGRIRCTNRTHFCCSDVCLDKRARDVACCHGSTYDPRFDKCCPQRNLEGFGHACAKNQECCGGTECCKKGEQCCNSGKLRYCAPKGRCCPKGQHRVTCGKGKALCCPEDEYCCGGTCCKPSQCHNGVCKKGCGPFGSCPGKNQACCGEGLPSEHCYDYTTTACCAPYCGDPGANPPCGSATPGNPFAGCCPPGQCCNDCFHNTGVSRRAMCCPESVGGKPQFGCCGNTCCNNGGGDCGPDGNTCV